MFNSLVAHQVLNKMDILLGLLLKPRLFEQFQSAPLRAPVVPPTMDPGRAPVVSHLEGGENSSHQRYSQCGCAKAGMNPVLFQSHFCEHLFHTGKQREQREITISARNVSNAFIP